MKFSKAYILTWALVLFAVPLAAQMDSAHAKHCSLATLNGSFGFYAQAMVVTQPPVQIVTTGIITYDGKGNLSGESMNNVDGSGGMPDSFTGTYTVYPDCTLSGQHTSPAGETLHYVGTITGSGILQEIHFVVTDPGVVAYGTDKRIPPGGCSLASLKGSYALFGQGTVTAYTPPALIAHAGVLSYDGRGKFAGKDTIALNGTTVPDTFTGTYTVTADCTVSVEIFSTAVGVVHELGRVTGDGKSREVHLIVTDPGFMVVEATRKQ
ncbi:MAG: hypothetical protein LAO24_21580 [Acidobacteriia bacterium]|nr:hypothetical protein [Terriglobia bacterium]